MADFIGFTEATGIPFDPVYTGKLMFAIRDKIESGFFKRGEKVVTVHTGGLQGIAGYVYRDEGVWGRYGELVCREPEPNRLRDVDSIRKP